MLAPTSIFSLNTNDCKEPSSLFIRLGRFSLIFNIRKFPSVFLFKRWNEYKEKYPGMCFRSSLEYFLLFRATSRIPCESSQIIEHLANACGVNLLTESGNFIFSFTTDPKNV